ncbi:MAG TPA: DNA internalization-related competence protein ComEC/Rec2 [Elusimicrobia bacterium]|nr:DNA internalization-related competence protein ComEC/Rec2 [Elusimicrobiota bacterium]
MSRILLVFTFFYLLVIILLNSYGYFLHPPLLREHFGGQVKNNPANYIQEPLPFTEPRTVLVQGEPEEITLKGKIISLPEKDAGKISFLLASEEISSPSLPPTKVQGKVLVNYVPPEEDIPFPYEYGDKIEISGFLKLPPGAVNPGSFDYRKYLARKEIYSLFYINPEKEIRKISSTNKYSLFYWTNLSRKKFLETITKNLPREEGSPRGEAGEILAGILIGEKSQLTPEIKKIFIDAGVMHILVVSGLNVGFVIAIFFWLFRWVFYLPRRTAMFLLFPVIVFYLFLTGAEAPVVRASIMAICVLLALLLKRETSIYQALLLALLIILLINPQSLFDVSVQLSFAATLGIVYLSIKFLKPFLTAPKPIVYALGTFFTSLAAQLSVNPLMAYYFHKISIIAILANLLVVPLAGIILASGFLLIFSSLFGGIILFLVKQINLFFLTGLIKMVNFFASLPKAMINVPQPSWLFFFWYYFTLITVFKIRKSSLWRNFFLGGQILCLTIFLSQHYLTKNQLEITFLSVGQGDAIFLEFPKGKNLLVDAGGGGNYDSGERIIAPYLWARGVWKIDRVILTHPDWQHYSGMKTILEKFKVKEFITNPEYSTEETYLEMREMIKKKKVNFREIWAGEKINLPEETKDPEIKFFNPKILTENKDDNLLAFQLKYQRSRNGGDKKISIFFPGDLSFEGQKKLAQENIGGNYLQSDILVIPAHGLKPVNEEFFKQVNPKYGIISTREPAGGILPQGLKIYSTHQSGTITLITDGEKIKIKTYLK